MPIAQPPPSAASYYPPPSMQQPTHPYPAIPSQSTSPYGQMLPQTQTPQPAQAPPGMGTLPPNILALLQQSSTQQSPLAPQQSSAPQYGMPPPPPQMISPPPMSSLPPGGPQPGGPGYQQLMAFLVSHPLVRISLLDDLPTGVSKTRLNCTSTSACRVHREPFLQLLDLFGIHFSCLSCKHSVAIFMKFAFHSLFIASICHFCLCTIMIMVSRESRIYV